MSINIVRKEEQHTREWSGGTTTQLYIFPKNSSYKDKTFSFRLSSAKINIEESTFTKLEGISRYIMILSGELELEHNNGQYRKTLKQFDTDQFLGDWDTKSKGKVIDFNLMTKGSTFGHIHHININPNKQYIIKHKTDYNHIAIYSYKGSFNINYLENHFTIKENDFVIINHCTTDISIKTLNNCDLIISKINSDY